MTPSKRLRRGLTIVGALALAGLTLAVGIILFGVAAGWFQTSLRDVTREADKDIQIIRSAIVIEAANYTADESYITLRNIGGTDVVILRIEILSSDGQIYNATPTEGYTNLTTLRHGERQSIESPRCSVCTLYEPITIRVWYVSASLFNPESPEEAVDKAQFVEWRLLSPTGSLPQPTCPLPNHDWLFLDYVDPVAYVSSGKIAWNQIRLRSVIASRVDDVSTRVTVTELTGWHRTRSGSGTLRSVSNEIQLINAYASGLQIPVEITVESNEADWTIIQKKWIFGGIPYKAHVSDILLIWSEKDRTVYAALLTLGVGQTGRYRVTVTLKDCNEDILVQEETIVNIPSDLSTPTSDDTFISFSHPVRFDQIYYIETSVREA